MKYWTCLAFIALILSSCQVPETSTEETKDTATLPIGEWDNFQQVWLENTDTDMHRVEVAQKHEHYHLAIDSLGQSKDSVLITFSSGRNGRNKLGASAVG